MAAKVAEQSRRFEIAAEHKEVQRGEITRSFEKAAKAQSCRVPALQLRARLPQLHHLPLFRLRVLGGAVRAERGVPPPHLRPHPLRLRAVAVGLEQGGELHAGGNQDEVAVFRGNLVGRAVLPSRRTHVRSRGVLR